MKEIGTGLVIILSAAVVGSAIGVQWAYLQEKRDRNES